MEFLVTKDFAHLTHDDLLSCWKWLVPTVQSVILVTCLGDLFLTGEDSAVYWLQTDSGSLTKVADTKDAFLELLNDDTKVDEWFLPEFLQELIAAGKEIKANEVYSFKLLPVLGGEYDVDNIEPRDICAHLSLTGQICEQLRDLPDGTKVTIKLKK